MGEQVPTRAVEAKPGWFRRAAEALGLSPRNARDPLGDAGERFAARHLRKQGYRIIGRNLRVPMGEADILALAPDGRTIVLAEVKTRRVVVDAGVSGGAFVAPPPEASITLHKRRKLVTILEHLARANRWSSRPMRIDAVAVEWPERGEPVVRHHAGAVLARARQGDAVGGVAGAGSGAGAGTTAGAADGDGGAVGGV